MNIEKHIRDIKDFPKPGIIFKDISPLLADAKAMNYTVEKMAEYCKNVDVIVGPDARGFLFGTPVANSLKKPFVMIRKANKLPGEVETVNYDLEYGSNTLEIQKGLIRPGDTVAIIDDVLATGGTIDAMIKLIESQGGIVKKIVLLIELEFLNGRNSFDKSIEITSLVKVK